MTFINKLPQNESFTVNAVHNATDCTVTIKNNGSYDIKSNWQLKVNGKVEGELTGCVVKRNPQPILPSSQERKTALSQRVEALRLLSPKALILIQYRPTASPIPIR